MTTKVFRRAASAVVLCLLLMILYQVLKPDRKVGQNYESFPNMHPANLPTGITSQRDCSTRLTGCDAEGKCSLCGEAEFSCVNVTNENHYVLNGQSVPVGRWCLPKPERDKYCNLKVGRWVWTESNQYCGDKEQCWRCECLYPDLFNNSDAGCANQQVCRVVGDENVLGGFSWDPFDSATADNPYDFDDDGNAKHSCTCPDGSLLLPGDPYRCYRDKCWDIFNAGNGTNLFSATVNGDDDVSCNCGNRNNGVTLVSGTLAGQCYATEKLCNGGTYKNDRKDYPYCDCGDGKFFKKCRSKYNQHPEIPPDLPLSDCHDPNNPIGEECVNPCYPNGIPYCHGGAICEIDDSNLPSCRCDTAYRNEKEQDYMNSAIGQMVNSEVDCNKNPQKRTRVVGEHCEEYLKWPVGATVRKHHHHGDITGDHNTIKCSLGDPAKICEYGHAHQHHEPGGDNFNSTVDWICDQP
jgi:hypothetical protein